MKLIFRSLLAVFFLANAGIIGHAQIIIDPEDPETPGGGTEGMAPQCITCCSFYPVDPTCQFYCGCETPNICSSFIGLQSPAVRAQSIAPLYKSISEARRKMADTSRGKSLLAAWKIHARRVAEIYRQRPALAQQVGKALLAHWPTDIWSGGGKIVERDALLELRKIVRQVARADTEADSDGLARVIRTQVLPRLDDGLIGRSAEEAFQCFISDNGC